MLLWAAERSGDTRGEPLCHQPGWDALGTPLQLQKGGKLLELGQEGWQNIPRDWCVQQSVDKCMGTFKF